MYKQLFLFRLVLILALVMTISGCRTEEKLFTAKELCQDKKHLDDPESIRDKYDNCLLFADEDLKDEEKCRERCEDYCKTKSMVTESILIDFSGCRCMCKISLE